MVTREEIVEEVKADIVGRIKAAIEESKRAVFNNKNTARDFDAGLCVGLAMALAAVVDGKKIELSTNPMYNW